MNAGPDPWPDVGIQEAIRDVFERRIPFNRQLGLRVERLADGAVQISLRTGPEHVGNYLLGSLHGGVISATLDTVGGLAALLASLRALERHGATLDVELLRERLSRLATVDLRVDYLRPATGSAFLATARVLRAGRRVVVVRSVLRAREDAPAEAERAVAYGTGSYIVV